MVDAVLVNIVKTVEDVICSIWKSGLSVIIGIASWILLNLSTWTFCTTEGDQGICAISRCGLPQAALRPREESSSGSQSSMVILEWTHTFKLVFTTYFIKTPLNQDAAFLSNENIISVKHFTMFDGFY